jgi:hypothetical protein
MLKDSGQVELARRAFEKALSHGHPEALAELAKFDW